MKRQKDYLDPFDPRYSDALERFQSTQYQPKTGARCSCKRGIQRDNCPTCEGTGWIIDFAAIRNRQS